MKKNSLTILTLSILISGCGSSSTPSEKDIEKNITKEIKNYCEYASISNLEKINGYEQKDSRGNIEYIVEFQYDLILKADNKWKSDYKNLNDGIAEAKEALGPLHAEINKIIKEANTYAVEAPRDKTITVHPSGNRYEGGAAISIEIYNKYQKPLQIEIESFMNKNKKWENLFSYKDVFISGPMIYLNSNRLNIPEEYELKPIKAPIAVEEKITEIPTTCIGRGEYQRQLETPLKFFERDFIYLTKMGTRGYEPEKTKSFMDGATKNIKMTRAMHKTENGWIFK